LDTRQFFEFLTDLLDTFNTLASKDIPEKYRETYGELFAILLDFTEKVAYDQDNHSTNIGDVNS
jgi:hypothetical protein